MHCDSLNAKIFKSHLDVLIFLQMLKDGTN